MSTTQSERLRGLLEPLVASRDLDLEEIEVTPAGKRRVLRIVVDSDEGVQLDECAELSREVSQVLDDTDVMGGAPYTLEVTSPGADRPLTEPRHYRRAAARLIKAQLHEGGELVARITAVDEDGLDLEVPGVKGRKPTARRVSFGEIAKARVELEFSRKSDQAGTSGERDAGHGGRIDENKTDENKEEA
ncbi:ribosome maturation factor RimP [Streptomyces sp. NBRC 110611]|uniref:ribosome maturation factor RimP n=1 Tax=Streptomyces sp. NBRC 110611 TaxID=1621259 RepID=UPI00082C6167|nr:ribosome maturation factor RimP [Streptomyces sp. NBRC 110611]GAU70053.1 ribosome maturation factor RimP [Streptomyces sp. NBRC 110611]